MTNCFIRETCKLFLAPIGSLKPSELSRAILKFCRASFSCEKNVERHELRSHLAFRAPSEPRFTCTTSSTINTFFNMHIYHFEKNFLKSDYMSPDLLLHSSSDMLHYNKNTLRVHKIKTKFS